MLKRFFDLIIILIAANIFLVPVIMIFLLIKLTSNGPALYWSRRVGKNGTFFMMPKFRSMYLNAPEVASDKLDNPDQHVTRIGSFLRRLSLDELPQIISVLRGDMSIVGPRPALHNQYDLIAKRASLGISILLPGVTGWAQVNGRDDIELEKKLNLDLEYLQRKGILFDLYIIILTVMAVIKSKGVSH